MKVDFKDGANWDDLKLFQCGLCGLVCRFALRAYVNEPTRHGPCMHYFCSHCADAVEDGEYFECTRCSPERLLQKNCLVPDYAVDQLVQIHLKEGLGRNYSHAERPRHYETDTSAQAKRLLWKNIFEENKRMIESVTGRIIHLSMAIPEIQLSIGPPMDTQLLAPEKQVLGDRNTSHLPKKTPSRRLGTARLGRPNPS